MTSNRPKALLAADTQQLGGLLSIALTALADGTAQRGGPIPAGGPQGVTDLAGKELGEIIPDEGTGAAPALAALGRVLTAGAADPADPRCAGHLHCPPLAVAVAADLLASALNQSLDSWDQGPAATVFETEVTNALAALVFGPGRGGGTVTTGGTESNQLGLLLAREHRPGRTRILCSAAAHFSVQRTAGFLGLGEDAVTAVPTGRDHRMDVTALQAAGRRAEAAGEQILAVVATAGTTDLGAVDPLPEVAAVARAHGAWLHTDAAYGGGALFSDQLKPLLDGLELADSVSLDLHKLGWQPAAAGVFLVRDPALFTPLERRVAYLNADEDHPTLLGFNPRTTRRPDSFKIAVTLRALGRRGLGELVDHCHELAHHAADFIRRHPHLELTAEPVLTSVVFRYLPGGPATSDQANTGLRRRLLAEGRAVVGRTAVGNGPGSVRLKLTLLNPNATGADVEALLGAVVEAGKLEEKENHDARRP